MSPKPKKKQAIDVISAEFLITKEFHTSHEFSLHIETVAAQRNITHMEVLMEYCEERDIEPVAVATFINTSLRSKIEEESESLHLLKPETTVLPK